MKKAINWRMLRYVSLANQDIAVNWTDESPISGMSWDTADRQYAYEPKQSEHSRSGGSTLTKVKARAVVMLW